MPVVAFFIAFALFGGLPAAIVESQPEPKAQVQHVSGSHHVMTESGDSIVSN